MRYRIKQFQVTRSGDNLLIRVKVPAEVYDALQVQSGSAELIGSHAQSIKNSIRLIADETTGGTILYATGSKVVGTTDPITSITKSSNNAIQIVLSLTSLIAAATADGDTEELVALSAIFGGEESIGHLWTIEMDFGDTPDDLIDAVKANATANKQAILNKIGDCVIFDYADSGLPAETGSGFCAYLDDSDFCIADMDCHGEHAAQYKVGEIIHPTSDGDQTIDLVVAKSVSSTPTDIRLDDYIMYGVTDTILWKKGGYYRVTGIYDVYDSDGYEKLETQLITYEELEPDTVTGLLMQSIERIRQSAGGGGGGIEIMTDAEHAPALEDLNDMIDALDEEES